MYDNLRDEAQTWGENNINAKQRLSLPTMEYENLYLKMWSHAMNKDKEGTTGLLLGDKFPLQVHGCI